MKIRCSSPVFVTLMGIAVLTGCTAQDPPVQKYDTFQLLDTVGTPDQPKGCPTPPTLPTPYINPSPPSSYKYKVLPIRGSASGAAMVGATTTAGSASPVTLAGSGTNFCIEVDLVSGPNTIKVYALDNKGCQSKSTMPYSVRYVPTTVQQDAGVTKPINLAKSQPISSKDTPGEGSLSYVNDGSTSSFAKFSFYDWDTSGTCDKCTWVKIDLGKAYLLSKFKIRWAPSAGSDYATCYTILTAANPAQNPDCSTNAGWKVTHKETAGIAVPKDITVQPVTARYVALLLYENASSWLWENFKLAEFEVWGQDPNATTPPPPDRCKK